MSVLMIMRQRMKAVETIKKITHAMRLISMSSHTRLRNKKTALTDYVHALTSLFSHIYAHDPTWHHPILLPYRNDEEEKSEPQERKLIILVGSQKGLCGNFNTSSFAHFERICPADSRWQYHIITVGKRAGDYIEHTGGTTVKRFDEFTQTTFTKIADQISDYILGATPHYASVSIMSSYSKSFFVQVSQETQLLPLSLPKAASEKEEDMHEGYQWEQSPNSLLTALAQSLLYASIQDILLTSLTAEQAARFVAMDSSTRNASNLLDDMKLDYNKKRQAKITRELTDLIGGL